MIGLLDQNIFVTVNKKVSIQYFIYIHGKILKRNGGFLENIVRVLF